MSNRTMRHTILVITAALALLAAGRNGDNNDATTEPIEPGTRQSPRRPRTPPTKASRSRRSRSSTADGPPGPDATNVDATAWLGPEDDEIGADVGFDPIVVEGDDVVVAITCLIVYREGAQVRVAVRAHPDTVDEQTLDDDPLRLGAGPGADAPDPDDPEVLEIALTSPDGATASTAQPPHSRQDLPAGEQPDEPILLHTTSQSTPGAWDFELWWWPLPDDTGTIEIAATWPARDLDATAELDAGELASARDAVVQLWNE